MKSRTDCASARTVAYALACCCAFLDAGIPGRVFAHGDLHDQIDGVSDRLAHDPNNAALLLRRAELYRLHGEWENALKDVDRVSQVDPKPGRSDLLRAKILVDAGQLQAARTALNQFLERQPNHVDGLITRALLLVKLGSGSLAAQDYSRAIAASPRPEPDYYLKRAEALRRATPPQLGEALAGLDEGIRKLGPLVTLELAAIDVEVALRNYDRALTRLDTARRTSARQESWLVRRAEILAAAGRIAEADKAYGEALKAIVSLPPHLRKTEATRQLETRVRSAQLAAASPHSFK